MVRGTDFGAASGSICMNMGSARFACDIRMKFQHSGNIFSFVWVNTVLHTHRHYPERLEDL
jgi:hypothetical protein